MTLLTMLITELRMRQVIVDDKPIDEDTGLYFRTSSRLEGKPEFAEGRTDTSTRVSYFDPPIGISTLTYKARWEGPVFPDVDHDQFIHSFYKGEIEAPEMPLRFKFKGYTFAETLELFWAGRPVKYKRPGEILYSGSEKNSLISVIEFEREYMSNLPKLTRATPENVAVMVDKFLNE